MTLFTDELVIWGRLVCYCVSVAAIHTFSAFCSRFPTGSESCGLTLLCLCNASIIKNLQGLENASLCCCSCVGFFVFFLVSQPDSIELLFFSEAKKVLSKIASLQSVCSDSSMSEGSLQLESFLFYPSKFDFHFNR